MALSVEHGIARAVALALARPARLGATRLIAVDGPSGSGKTWLAPRLADAIARERSGCVVRPERVVETGRSEFRSSTQGLGNLHEADTGTTSYQGTSQSLETPTVAVVSTDLLATWEHPVDWWPVLDEQLLRPIAAGEVARMPVMQWVSGNPRPGGATMVPPVDVLIVEGVSSGRRAVTDRLSVLIWVEVQGSAARLERAVARDGEAQRRFLARWQEQERQHFATDATRVRADVLVRPD